MLNYYYILRFEPHPIRITCEPNRLSMEIGLFLKIALKPAPHICEPILKATVTVWGLEGINFSIRELVSVLSISTDTNTGIGATLKYGFIGFGKFSGLLALQEFQKSICSSLIELTCSPQLFCEFWLIWHYYYYVIPNIHFAHELQSYFHLHADEMSTKYKVNIMNDAGERLVVIFFVVNASWQIFTVSFHDSFNHNPLPCNQRICF